MRPLLSPRPIPGLLGTGRLILLAALLGGCSSPVPKEIRERPPGDLRLAQVLGNPQSHLGDRVRWGGHIVAVENAERETHVILVSRPLDYRGRPEDTDQSSGRFLARFDDFRDPATYQEGRVLTVAGVLVPAVIRPVGDYPYRYPVVRVETAYLWPPLPDYPPGYYWYPYCSPFYGPYHDPWCYPWYRPRHYYRR